MSYQPKTGEACHCKRGVQRDNCPDCEGTGMRIDFARIRLKAHKPHENVFTAVATEFVKKYGRH
jgi:hypothetical protein